MTHGPWLFWRIFSWLELLYPKPCVDHTPYGSYFPLCLYYFHQIRFSPIKSVVAFEMVRSQSDALGWVVASDFRSWAFYGLVGFKLTNKYRSMWRGVVRSIEHGHNYSLFKHKRGIFAFAALVKGSAHVSACDSLRVLLLSQSDAQEDTAAALVWWWWYCMSRSSDHLKVSSWRKRSKQKLNPAMCGTCSSKDTNRESPWWFLLSSTSLEKGVVPSHKKSSRPMLSNLDSIAWKRQTVAAQEWWMPSSPRLKSGSCQFLYWLWDLVT